MPFEDIKTERLILRKLTPAIYQYIFSNYSDQEQMNVLCFKSLEELKTEKEKFKKGFSTHKISFVNFKILDRQTNECIGNCGFHTWYFDHLRAEIGYDLMADSHKRKGFMSEALNTIISYGFNEMNLNRIEAFVGLENQASLNLLDKFGFKQEGLLRQHYKKNDVIEDSLLFSLLKEDHY